MILKFNTKGEAGSLEGTVIYNQPVTTTLAKNAVIMMGLIESFEAELTGVQDVLADLQEIIHSIDNVLVKQEHNHTH
jgi:hypothetical protein